MAILLHRCGIRRRLREFRRSDSGNAIVEFGFIGPVFIGMLAAVFEFSGIMFVQTLLEASAREASRYGITGFESGGVSREDQIRAIIEDFTFGIIDLEELETETLVYDSFSAVGEPEPFTDENGNEAWDNGEPFTDVNGNGAWDDDMGAAGLGGPGDVVVYRMSYEWPIMIPLFVPFFRETVTLSANIAVRNEPFGGAPGGA